MITHKLVEQPSGTVPCETTYWERLKPSGDKNHHPSTVPAIGISVVISSDGTEVWRTPTPISKYPYKGTGSVAALYDKGMWGVDGMEQMKQQAVQEATAYAQEKVRLYEQKLAKSKKMFKMIIGDGGILL